VLAWLSVWSEVQTADLHIAQLMPLPLTVSCFSIIQIGFTFLDKGPLNGCVCVVRLHKGFPSYLQFFTTANYFILHTFIDIFIIRKNSRIVRIFKNS